jgi:hypothetical protein
MSLPGAPLLAAAGVVVFGTMWVDPSRLWLLLVPVSLLLAAFAAGTLVDRAVGGLPTGSDPPAMFQLAVHIGVGLACLSLLAVFSALAGVLWVAGIAALPLAGFGLWQVIRQSVRLRPSRPHLVPALGGLAMGAAWLVAWLWATIPPTFFDELAYHLVIPQRALATGELQVMPWVYFTLMPHASDLLLAWGMAFGGDLGARATLFALWVACSLAAWGLTEMIAWPRSGQWAGPLVAGALATSPTLWFLATLPFAETCLSLGVVAAAAVLAAAHDDRRPWVSFGLLLGLIATVKLSGLYWVVAALAAAAVAGWSRRELAMASFVALASVTPWWIRAFLHTGNPIYPMAYELLGGHFWSKESHARVLGDLPYGTGGLDLAGLMRLPLDLVLYPERFGSASEAGALAIGAVCMVLTLPAVARVAGLGARERRLCDATATLVLVAGICWVATSPTTRFFAPGLVLGLSALAAAALRLGRTGQVVALTCVLALGAWGTSRYVGQHAFVFSSYEVALGREETDAYMARQIDHFGAARFVRETLPAQARLLFIGETRPYYFAREAVAPSAYDSHPLQRWVLESSSTGALARRLDAEGISHVVLNVREFKRIHDSYGVLAFSGEGAEAHDRRLKGLPRVLRLLFAGNGVFVFEVPKP